MIRRTIRWMSWSPSRANALRQGEPGEAFSNLLSCLHGREGAAGAQALFEASFRVPFRAFKTDLDRYGCLERYCGSPSGIEDLVVLMMKVYADLNKLDDVRFMFVLGTSELQRPSTYMVNTFLISILRTDSFTEHEVDNIVELCRLRGIQRDIATELCLFMLQLRMGHNVMPLWDQVHAASLAALKPAATRRSDGAARQQNQQYQHQRADDGEDSASAIHVPYLPQLLRDVFALLAVSQHNVTAAIEAFRLVQLADSSLLTPATLIPFLTILSMNRAAPVSAALEVFRQIMRLNVPGLQSGEGSSATPFLLKEIVLMRLMQKCVSEKDSASAEYLQQLCATCPAYQAMESHDNFQHLAAGAHAAAGRLALALDTIEDDVRNPTNGFATTFSVVNTKENTMLVNTFGSECPFQLISRQLAAHAGGGDRDVLLELLRERKGRERIVTLRSLNLMLSATVVTGDAEACMWLLKSVFAEFAQLPSVESLMFAAQCVGQHRDGAAIDEIVQLTLSSPDIVPNHALLTAFLRWAVRFGECARAMAFVGLHVEYGTRLDGRLSVRLLKQLCVLGDVASVERLLEAINTTHSEPPDPKVIMLCSAHLAKFGLEIKTARSSS